MEIVMLLVGLVLGVVLGVLVGRLSAPNRSTTATIGLDPAVVEAQQARVVAEVRAGEAAARAQVEQQLAAARAAADGLRAQLDDLRAQHEATVRQHREDAARREAEQQQESAVLQQLTPVAAQLKSMAQKVDDLEKQRAEQHGQLASQIRASHDSAERSRQAAETLSSALRNNAVRGAYGETQLESIVESAGLLNRIDYATQESIVADSGQRRPDMVIKLPGRKQLAIDAKVPYTAFIDSHADDIDEERRAQLLTQHAKQVRAHVDALSAKEYWSGLTSSPEFTVAFIPSEAILNAAISAEPGLVDHAFSKGIVLATPINLWAVLKTVAFTWKQEDLAENAQELVDLGRELYKRLGTLSDHVTKLGRAIESTVRGYNEFVGSLESRVLVAARRLDGVDEARMLGQIKQLDADTRSLTAAELTALESLEPTDSQTP